MPSTKRSVENNVTKQLEENADLLLVSDGLSPRSRSTPSSEVALHHHHDVQQQQPGEFIYY